MFHKALTYSPITLIRAPKIHTDLLWDLVVLFIALSVLYFISVFYFRNKLSKASKKLKEKKTEFSPIVSEFLFYDETDSKEEKSNYINLKIQIRELLKDKYNRKVLTDVLLDLRKDVSGQTQINLFELYKNLELHKDAYIKLKSWKWQIVTSGILELTKMQVSESYSFLIKFINDKRPTIRKHAEIAVVTLDNRGISYFLDTTKYRISEWQQLKLLDVLRNKENFEIPKFKLWLTSKNKHVVLFALRLIKYYNQNDARKSLIPLIKHKSNQIKQEAINCIEEFYVEEAMDTLKLVFWKSSEDVKMSILSAIATIGTESDLDFLVEIEQRVRSFAVRSKAISTINEIAPETILPSEHIEKDIAFENTIPDIIAHEDAPEISISDQLQQKLEEKNAAEGVEKIEEPEVEESNSVEIVENKIETEDKSDNVDDVLVQRETVEDLDSTWITEQKDVVEPEKEQGIESSIEIEGENALEESVDQDKILQNIEVVAESITQNQEQMDISKEQEETKEELEISLDFLPFVIEPQEEKNVSEAQVITEEENIEGDKALDLSFLPLVVANIENPKTHSVSEVPTQQQDNIMPKPESPIDFMELDFLPLVEEHKEIVKEEIATQQVDNLFDFIPKPHQISDEESEKLLLLADIEEFGDAREIPLLDEYLANEKSPFLIERIEEIMEEIVKRTPIVISEKKEESIEDSSLVRGFISEIFANQDVESQLILLNEIAIVGDEKEAAFLRTLIKETSEAEVIEKAKEALAIIKGRLEIEPSDVILNEESETLQEALLADEMEEETHPMFDVNFELSPNTEDVDITLKTEKKTNNKSSSFGNQLSEISKRIKDILNG